MDRGIASAARHPAAIYGVIGFTAILGQAVYRLALLAVEPIRTGHMTPTIWALYGASIAFNAYSEGYRAFQLQVAPRVVGRALHLARHRRPLHVALAPFFCTGLFHATRKRLVITWSVYAGLVVLIVAVRQLPQPWRGMVDAGVVVGLTWGIVAILWYWARALAGRSVDFELDLPPPGRDPHREGDEEAGRAAAGS